MVSLAFIANKLSMIAARWAALVGGRVVSASWQSPRRVQLSVEKQKLFPARQAYIKSGVEAHGGRISQRPPEAQAALRLSLVDKVGGRCSSLAQIHIFD